MSRHQTNGAQSLQLSDSTEIRVPLKADKFRKRQSVASGTATMGVAMAVGFWAFPAVGIYAAIIDPTQRKIGIVLAVCSSILPLLVGIMAWTVVQRSKQSAKTLQQNLPALLINQAGIQDNASAHMVGFIPWAEIQAVAATTHHTWDRFRGISKPYSGIAFVIKDMNVLLKRKPGLVSQEMGLDPIIRSYSEVFIPQAMFDADVNGLVNEINNFRARMNV